MKKLKTNQKGFTLIELLVVIAIIGLLASVVLLAQNSARQKSRDAKRLADIRQIASAMELYFDNNGGYASGATSLGFLAPTYLGTVPAAPTPADNGCTTASNNYPVVAITSTNYTIGFCLGATTGGITVTPTYHILTNAGIQ